jgi:hypothetical protein
MWDSCMCWVWCGKVNGICCYKTESDYQKYSLCSRWQEELYVASKTSRSRWSHIGMICTAVFVLYERTICRDKVCCWYSGNTCVTMAVFKEMWCDR